MYRGRFAPSPTGPLHFGSLVAAAASYLDARARGGEWLVRMEDLDTPRVRAGSAEMILSTLERFGFEWDGPVWYQSTRTESYKEALRSLGDVVYPCGCSRKETGARYPGTCREGLAPGHAARAWRVRTLDETLCFDDRVQGRYCQNLYREIGDFVLLRADGLFAYQLAVVVDDAAQNITDVVRGADLLDSTPRQIFLQRLLAFPEPGYLHVPVASNTEGQKLSKQTLALAIRPERAANELVAALEFLGQRPPHDLRLACPAEVWSWAIPSWNASLIPKALSMTAPAEFLNQ